MSSEMQARDPQFDKRVTASFAQQGLMSTFAAELDRVEPGLVEIVLPFADGLTQQDGFLHAAVVIAAMDSACGYAAGDGQRLRLRRLHSDGAGCPRPDR